MNDLRFAFRQLLTHPSFTAVAVLTLGIGANTAIFSFVNAVPLRPLPYSDADRLVCIYDSAPRFGILKFGLIEPMSGQSSSNGCSALRMKNFHEKTSRINF
jgi:hypothetical protein